MSAENDIPGTGTQSAGGTSPNPAQFSEMLDKVLANPEIIRTVASALGSMQAGNTASPKTESETGESSAVDARESGGEAPTGAGPGNISADKLPEIMAALSPMMSSLGKKGPGEKSPPDRRAVLLNALRPYLSDQRGEAIDYIIKFSKLSEILKGLM